MPPRRPSRPAGTARRRPLIRTAGTVLAGALLCAACAGAAQAPTRPAPVASTAASTVAVPTSAPASVPRPPASPGPVVLLDPGHNGGNASDTSAINRQVPDGRGGKKACNTTGTSTDAGYAEHAFTWDLAQRVKAQLEAAGFRVALTRPDDKGVGPCVDERGAAGARAGAAAAVSLHADGAAASGRGFHVAYSSPPLNAAQSGPARTLATSLRDAMQAGNFAPANYIGKDGLDGRDDLTGLNAATVPTALVECANMRNAAEAGLVSSPEGRDRYARAITAGIRAFLHR
ncbi:N-acetylmuramoyl-L-alanine amidase [Pseudonocardia endophytica]|uniref:N-acetylmuramoyl-L-alanine amidase n=1 Tax=Pseudonocardia endophytica TaxID=401976 RepID=A0A4R1I015_PSEEN|nr:N-acetylmuramoyl-L-alanine amidase [Pseudonocardia endophytica]TCK27171.1 N-acetylmuramoyl-L-alanine amidase [Pseudonocardia endophytica]